MAKFRAAVRLEGKTAAERKRTGCAHIERETGENTKGPRSTAVLAHDLSRAESKKLLRCRFASYRDISPAKNGAKEGERRVSKAWNEHDLISN
jgi:hypothetical protein